MAIDLATTIIEKSGLPQELHAQAKRYRRYDLFIGANKDEIEAQMAERAWGFGNRSLSYVDEWTDDLGSH